MTLVVFEPKRIDPCFVKCSQPRSTSHQYRNEQYARTLQRWMPMRISALFRNDGTDPLACLPLQRMPAPIWECLRNVHAGQGRQPDSHWSDEAIYAFCPQWQRGDGCVLPRVRRPHLSCSEVRP